MSKKMCAYSKRKVTLSGASVLPHRPSSEVDYVKQYTLPVLREGKEWFIEFYCYDPSMRQLRRKRIKCNRIKGVRARRAYARDVMERIGKQLARGWNPWIEQDLGNLHTCNDVFDSYEVYLEKMLSTGYIRKQTYSSYKSRLKNLREYVREVDTIHYLYQMDRAYISHYLDYIFIERDNGGQTRNNYLSWLTVFCGWCVERSYLTVKPTDGIKFIDKRLLKKARTVIPTDVVTRIGKWAQKHDPHFLLACQLLYNCFIRPVEMTRLKVGWFDLMEGTVVIPAEASKNHQTMTVTIPKRVLHYAIDLGVFNAAVGDFVFSTNLKPGTVQIDPKLFRDHWAKVRKALKLPKQYQFYSLKDTGITEMLDHKMASITVRDQARHSSLAITELYTRHLQRANPDVREWEGSL